MRDVGNISVGETRNVLRKMMNEEAQEPDDIPVEVKIALGTKGVHFSQTCLTDSCEERRCQMNGGGCLYRCTRIKGTSRSAEIIGGSS